MNVPLGSIRELAAHLAENSNGVWGIRTELGNKAKEQICSTFSIDFVYKQFTGVYISLLDN